MHTLLCGKKTPDHKPLDHKRSKKDKRNKNNYKIYLTINNHADIYTKYKQETDTTNK